uniref:NADH-ubiquinone oxidoreductase chain 5 n=1 Tax=Stenocephus fraxini TaxID=2963023 RepID=A0A9E8Z7C9_9HYME|nr:NADH dehydrogenase subunit 5 [Stenocephus fraxini]WAK85075.1 NADH dehydrogenase subunit 5 [Stenocephus fraxini]
MLSLYMSFFFFFFSIMLFNLGILFLLKKFIYLMEWNLFSLNSVDFYYIFLFDWMSMVFMSFVLLISSMVMLYSYDYMKEDLFFNRFIYLVFLFVFSMLLMILSPNLLSILLGWDGLGLISYCLVAYYQNMKSYNASMLTVLMNRLGDSGLMMSLGMLYYMGSWNLMLYSKVDCLIILMFILAAFTKSAQIPFSSWLPAAMAAPTPVSSLVHSSTLVTAGVYLLIRYNHMLMSLSYVSKYMFILSVLTMFMSGLGANWENDLKKIIALSTLSQLGLMMSILFLGFCNLAFFHLLTHAMFKALLFMCAGVIIHSMKNFQDIRYMGGMVKLMPYTMVCFNISNMALMGLPFLAGFYSKDLILEEVMFMGEGLYIFLLFFMSVGLTVSYSLRLFFYSLFSEIKMISTFSLSDHNFCMNMSMIIMVFMSIVSGKFLLFYLSFNIDFIILPYYLKSMVLFFMMLGSVMGAMIFYFKFSVSLKLIYLKDFFNKMWFLFNIFYYLIYLGMTLSMKYTILNDKIWNESILFKNFLEKMFFFIRKIDFFYINSFKLLLFIYFYLLFFMFFFV